MGKKLIGKIPEVDIKKEYFLYLFFIVFLSALLHELGHALALVMSGGKILSYQLAGIVPEPKFSADLFFFLGGPLATLIICLFAAFEILRDESNSGKWLAAIFANFRPALLLTSYELPRDEAFFVNTFKIPPALIFAIYLIVYSFPMLILIKAPKLPPGKKIAFYLYNLVVILAVFELLEALNKIIFR